MSSIAIRAEGLGKRYNIGERQAPYKTVRESITGAFGVSFRWLNKQNSYSSGNYLPQNPESKAIWALKDLSFEVRAGDVVGIVGRNGAGKSTLLKILSRVTKPTVGRAEVYGRLGSLLEVGTGFHPELTGRENIYLNGAILGMKKNEIERKFDEIVMFAEIEKFLDTPVKYYSSGMYVRLAFAVAAHLEPEILIVDEVLSVGDIAFQKKCLGKMRDVSNVGRTVLFVSHNLSAIQRLCSYGYLLHEGQLISQGSIDTVINTYYELIGETNSDKTDVRSIPEGTVRYIKWRLQSLHNPQEHHCFTQEQCVFDFQLVVRRVVHTANFGLLIFDNRGNWILGIRRGIQSDQCVQLTEGIYSVQFFVPTLPLKPGSYTLQAIVGDLYEGTLDEWYAQPKLTVLPKDELMLDGWGGILNIDGEVELRKLE